MQIKDIRTLTKDIEFVNPPGRHERRRSKKAHNEILKIIVLKNRVLGLPEGLRR